MSCSNDGEQADGEQADDEQADDEQADDEQADDEQADDEQADDEQADDEQADDSYFLPELRAKSLAAINTVACFLVEAANGGSNLHACLNILLGRCEQVIFWLTAAAAARRRALALRRTARRARSSSPPPPLPLSPLACRRRRRLRAREREQRRERARARSPALLHSLHRFCVRSSAVRSPSSSVVAALSRRSKTTRFASEASCVARAQATHKDGGDKMMRAAFLFFVVVVYFFFVRFVCDQNCRRELAKPRAF